MANTVNGNLVLLGLPELACFESFEQLLQALPTFLGVEVPTSITNVVIGNVEPTDSQRNYLWVRYDDSGSFVGFYLFSAGTWNLVYPAPNQIFRTYGDSRDIPAGFELISASTPGFTAAMVTHLQGQWLLDPTSTYYVIFDMVFIGF